MKSVIPFMIFLFIISATFVGNSVGASSIYSERLLDQNLTKVYSLSSDKSLFVDKFNHQIEVQNLATESIDWKKNLPIIYDSQVFYNPLKIVIITSQNNHPKKITFAMDGTVLSSQIFTNLNLQSYINPHIAWSPPSTTQKEKIAIADQRKLSIFQSPWKKPLKIMDYTSSTDSKYESTLLEDEQMNSTYVILKLIGASLTQSQDLYRIFNINTGQRYTLSMQWNTSTELTIENNEIAINSSSIFGSSPGIHTNVPYHIFTRYDLPTGKILKDLTTVFKQTESNWETDYFNHQFMFINTQDSTIGIYNRNAKNIWEIDYTGEAHDTRFIGDFNNRIFLLKYDSKDGTVLTSQSKIQ
jgi:hypothetical protein